MGKGGVTTEKLESKTFEFINRQIPLLWISNAAILLSLVILDGQVGSNQPFSPKTQVLN